MKNKVTLLSKLGDTNMKVLVLKELAREYDLDPYKFRMALRAAGLKPNGGRWKWDEDEVGLKAVRSVAEGMSGVGVAAGAEAGAEARAGTGRDGR